MSVKNRFGAFKRVLLEAAKPPPLSAAYYAYRAASNGDERRAAYAAMTAGDQRVLWESVHESIDARLKTVAEELRTIEAESKIRAIAERSVRRAAEDSRIAVLPPPRRVMARIKRALNAAIGAVATGFLIIFIAAFVIGNIVNFLASLVYAWYLWAALFGSLFVVWFILMSAIHWRVALSVTRAVPTALHAAIVER